MIIKYHNKDIDIDTIPLSYSDFPSFIYFFVCLYSYNHSKHTEQYDATRILMQLFYNFTHSHLISFHSDWQILIYLPFLQSCHFKQKHRICNLLFVFFSPHKIIPQRFIQDNVGISSLFSIPEQCSIVWRCYNVFSPSPVEGYLRWARIFSTTFKAAVNIQVFL